MPPPTAPINNKANATTDDTSSNTAAPADHWLLSPDQPLMPSLTSAATDSTDTANHHNTTDNTTDHHDTTDKTADHHDPTDNTATDNTDYNSSNTDALTTTQRLCLPLYALSFTLLAHYNFIEPCFLQTDWSVNSFGSILL